MVRGQWHKKEKRGTAKAKAKRAASWPLYAACGRAGPRVCILEVCGGRTCPRSWLGPAAPALLQWADFCVSGHVWVLLRGGVCAHVHACEFAGMCIHTAQYSQNVNGGGFPPWEPFFRRRSQPCCPHWSLHIPHHLPLTAAHLHFRRPP